MVFRVQSESMKEGVGRPHLARRCFRERVCLTLVSGGESFCAKEGCRGSHVSGRLPQALGDTLGPHAPSPAASFGNHCVLVYNPAQLCFWTSLKVRVSIQSSRTL